MPGGHEVAIDDPLVVVLAEPEVRGDRRELAQLLRGEAVDAVAVDVVALGGMPEPLLQVVDDEVDRYTRTRGDVDDLVADLGFQQRSEEHTSELQSRGHLVCRLLLEKKK